MSDFEKQLNKELKSIKLTVAEKRDLEARVVSFMEYHPRRETVSAKKAQAYLDSKSYATISIYNRYVQAAVGAFAILIFVVVPTVAEKAVPGDVLYPIKVSINEEIRATLTFSATEKIEWETERLERRIAEVRLLESEGRLTDEVEAEAVEAVKAHAEAAQEEINKLRDTDAEEASLAEVVFESALEVQSEVLSADQEEADSPEVTTDLALVVQEAQVTVEATKGTTRPPYEKVNARLEAETTRAYEFFTSLNGIVTDEERAEIERRLEDIDRKIADGMNANEVNEAEGVVAEELLGALADTQKLISFMTDIDVRNSVSVETLVPIELTDEERLTIVVEQNATAKSILIRVEALEEGSADEAVMEKVLAGVGVLKSLLEQLVLAAEVEDVETQVTIGEEVGLMALDIENIIRPFEPEEEPVAEPEVVVEEPAEEVVVEETEVTAEEILVEDDSIDNTEEIIEETESGPEVVE